MNDYKLILRSEVPEWLRDTCDRAVTDAARELGIKIPVVRWYTGPGREFGWVDEDMPHQINLVVDRMSKTNVYIARARCYHEARHVYQNETLRHYGSRKEREADANEFAFRATGYSCENIESWEL